MKIGQLIGDNLVEDGATLQMGIGSIPDAVLSALKNHKDLGIHSEMFSVGVIDLVRRGCVTNNNIRPLYLARLRTTTCYCSNRLSPTGSLPR
ncbi:4-hydroxybutyrate coenzyme A transferase [Papilio machaon]|uniref:4-hydroxybutyrate coenzyme A transferase n=1 Tax=Papilio machaon TaxID=76193 RepID=A0A0N1IL12_PAPMA|nr:4-hydroxybutyrate coenzyme A transferase [Papilio machaon]